MYQWIKTWGSKGSLPKSSQAVEIIEIDEMHSYVQQKNYCWIWIAVDRLGKRHLSYVYGDRSTKTGLRLWEAIKSIDSQWYCRDYSQSYAEFVVAEKHIQTKAEIYTVEGYNSRIRHYLARFKRKGKCYSKAVHMIEKSLNLLMLKLNNDLAIQY